MSLQVEALALDEVNHMQALASKMGNAELQGRCRKRAEQLQKKSQPKPPTPLEQQLANISYARAMHVNKLSAALDQLARWEKAMQSHREWIAELNDKLENYTKQHDDLLGKLKKPEVAPPPDRFRKRRSESPWGLPHLGHASSD